MAATIRSGTVTIGHDTTADRRVVYTIKRPNSGSTGDGEEVAGIDSDGDVWISTFDSDGDRGSVYVFHGPEQTARIRRIRDALTFLLEAALPRE